jgi:autotransporter-associated beta strand protein
VPPGQTQAVSSVIADGSSPGTVELSGGGTLVLSAANTYTGSTTIGAGTLSIGAGGSIATSSGVNLAASGTVFDISGAGNQAIGDLIGVTGSSVTLGADTLTLGTADSTDFAGVISGTGGVIMQGSGTLTLTGANTYTGPTTINAGTLAIGPGGAIAASGAVNLAAAGTTFDISTGGSQTIGDLTGVAGSAVTLGANTLTLGTADSTDFAGVISGTGGVMKQGSGTLTLTGANSYTGATTINAGTLALGAGGSIAAGSAVSLAAPGTVFDISTGGSQTVGDLSGIAGSAITLGPNTLTLGTQNSTSIASVISGGGGLIKQGSGTLMLSGSNTYSGGTFVINGTLLGNAASLQGNITDDATVAFNQASRGTYAGTLAGNGSFIVEGLGGLILTGNSSGFAGTTLVNGGGLIIGPASNPGASLGGSVTVENGGLVQGHGTIGGSLSNISGLVVPMTTAGNTLAVGGQYTQGAAGTLGIGISPNGSTRLAVAGLANLGGTLDIAAAAGGYVPFSHFTILTSDTGVSGSFGQITGTLPILPLTVEYLPHAVDLLLGGFTGVTGNETAVANALNAAFATASGDFATVLGTAVNLTAAQMQQSLSSFGGQIYGNLAEVSLQDRRLFLGAMEGRIWSLDDQSPSATGLGSGGAISSAWGRGPNGRQLAALDDTINDPVGIAASGAASDARAATPAPAADTTPAPAAATTERAGGAIGDPVGIAASQSVAAPVNSGNVWARGFGQFGSIDTSRGGSLGSSYSTGGGAIGADLVSDREHLFGFAVSGGQSSLALDTNPENGTISFVQLGVYGAHALSWGFALEGAAAYAHDYYDVDRGIYLPGTSRVASSSHGGNDAAVDIGLSRPYLASGWQVTPRIGLSYYHIGQSAFSESGAGSLDLAVAPGDLNALYSRVGLAIADPFELDEIGLLPEIRVAWLHNFLDNASEYNASFTGTGAASFGEVGPKIGRDAADVGAGVSFAITQTAIPGQMSGFLRYQATLTSHEFANAVAAGMRLKW